MTPKVKVLSTLIIVILLLGTGNLIADEAAEVKALVEQGVIMAVIQGEKPTLKAIQDVNGPFIKE